jgi:Putative polyhydroxyalkanoic acid system protein (PHA_gran_rgn)
VPEPITVTISHSLGRDEARRRLDEGFGYVRSQLAPFVSSINYSWMGYRLDFRLAAIGQSINGLIVVEDRLVRIELGLPPPLHMLSKPIIERIRAEGVRLLDKPGG